MHIGTGMLRPSCGVEAYSACIATSGRPKFGFRHEKRLGLRVLKGGRAHLSAHATLESLNSLW